MQDSMYENPYQRLGIDGEDCDDDYIPVHILNKFNQKRKGLDLVRYFTYTSDQFTKFSFLAPTPRNNESIGDPKSPEEEGETVPSDQQYLNLTTFRKLEKLEQRNRKGKRTQNIVLANGRRYLLCKMNFH